MSYYWCVPWPFLPSPILCKTLREFLICLLPSHCNAISQSKWFMQTELPIFGRGVKWYHKSDRLDEAPDAETWGEYLITGGDCILYCSLIPLITFHFFILLDHAFTTLIYRCTILSPGRYWSSHVHTHVARLHVPVLWVHRLYCIHFGTSERV